MKGPGPSKLRINRPDPYKRKTRKEKSRFLASLEITLTETDCTYRDSVEVTERGTG
jgi:hypothetical protein